MVAKIDTSKDPYQEVANIVESACKYYADHLVTLMIDGRFTSQILLFDAEKGCFVWMNDWYEGEKEVSLIGFAPIEKLRLYGFMSDFRNGTVSVRWRADEDKSKTNTSNAG